MKLKIISRWTEQRAARHEPEVRRSLARGYWVVLLVIMLIVSAFSVAFGVWQFTRHLGPQESDIKLGTPQVPLHRGDLQAALEAFDAQQRRGDGASGRRRASVSLSDWRTT